LKGTTFEALDYKPFQSHQERQKQIQNEGFQSETEDRGYTALHEMLQILEDNDPTLRLSARSWLQDSKKNYDRIIDPLLKEFMKNNHMFRSFSGQLFYT
jgi:hypothetical protein